jgi:hypothetical protein
VIHLVLVPPVCGTGGQQDTCQCSLVERHVSLLGGSDRQLAVSKLRQITNVAIKYLAAANMISDGQLTGLLEASHHVDFLTFRGINRKDCDLVEHDAVLKGLSSFHVKPDVLNTIQSPPGVLVMDIVNDMTPLNLGFVR